MMIVHAESCLDSVMKSVCDGSVTVETFELLQKYSTEYLRLAGIYEGIQKKRHIAAKLFRQRESELSSFLSLHKQLSIFVHLSRNFYKGK